MVDSRSHKLSRAVSVSVLLAVLIALGIPSGVVDAATNGDTTVEPFGSTSATPRTNFTYELAAAETLQDAVVVVNATDQPQTYFVYPANPFNTPEGGFAVGTRDDAKDGATTWVALPPSVETVGVEIPAGAQARIPFTVTVPPGTSGGDYATGIAAVPADAPVSTEGDLAITKLKAVAVAMFIRVEGPLRPSLRVENIRVEANTAPVPFVTDGRTTVAFDLVNDGNTRLAPVVDVAVDGLLGQEIHQFDPTSFADLLPGGRFTVLRTWDGAPLFGKGSVRVAATAEGASTTRSAGFWAPPWWLLWVLLIAGLIVGWRRLRKVRQQRAVEAPSDSDDALDAAASAPT